MRVAAWLGSCTTAIVLGAALGVAPAYAQVDEDTPVVCIPGGTTGTDGTTGAAATQQSGQTAGAGSSVAGIAGALLGTGTPSADAGSVVAQQEPEEDADEGTSDPDDGTSDPDEGDDTVTGPGTCVEDDVDFDCADFADQAAAQKYFLSQGGSRTNNVDNLDADNDGVACENLADDGDKSDEEVTPVGDDGSEASTGGGQVEDVPVGSAQTGGA